MTTRSKQDIFLIGKPQLTIKDNQLPTRGDVIHYFFYQKLSHPNRNHSSIIICGTTKEFNFLCDNNCDCICRKVSSIYDKAGIPIIQPHKLKAKVEVIVQEHKSLYRHKSRVTTKEETKRTMFINSLSTLFECMPRDVEIKIDKDKKRLPRDRSEDILFIRDQRGPRKLKIGGPDKRYEKSVKRRQFSQERQDNAKMRKCDTQVETNLSDTESSSLSEEPDKSSSSPYEMSEVEIEDQPTTSKQIVKDTVLLSKTKKVSVRTQSEIITQVAETAGLTVAGMSRSTVHRIGKNVIKETAALVREKITESKEKPKQIHFDGKMVKEYTGGKKLVKDRLAISMKCEGENTLLGIPPCLNSTGECQTEVIINLLEEYDINEGVTGLVFDTTASNTGKEKGVCTRLNEYLGRPILHLACRHHVYECHIKNISKLFRATCGPDNSLFKKLQENWNEIKYNQAQLVKYEYGINQQLDIQARKSLDFCANVLKSDTIPRGDYRELANLVLFYLSPDQQNIVLRIPGSISHARFMAQSIYFMKLKLLSTQINLVSTAAAKKEVDSISEFVALFYTCWFLKSSITTVAPRLDLEALWEMIMYREYRPEIAERCIRSMSNHLWYLHPSIIPFSLLDSELKEDEKREICKAIIDLSSQEQLRFKYEHVKIENLDLTTPERPSLANFVAKESLIVFDMLKHDQQKKEWMLLNSELWPLMTPFKQFQEFIHNIDVVNDSAERNIKLLQDFVTSSNIEELRQDLFLSIEYKRKDVKGKRKSSNKDIK